MTRGTLAENAAPCNCWNDWLKKRLAQKTILIDWTKDGKAREQSAELQVPSAKLHDFELENLAVV
jgi:hypothetical protein